MNPYEQEHLVSGASTLADRPVSAYSLTESYGPGAHNMPPYGGQYNDPGAYGPPEIPYGAASRSGISFHIQT